MPAIDGETILKPDLLSISNSLSNCTILPMISFYRGSPLLSPGRSLLLNGRVIFEVGVIPFEKIRESSGCTVFEIPHAFFP
jgi:hypothetical protein